MLRELEVSPDSIDIETGVHKFVEWIRSGKLEIKAHPAENLHAKVYIMTFADGDRDKGRVITVSSNLTQAGLQDNLEFNVELKNRADYDFALAKFDLLWRTAVDVSEPYADTLLNKSPFATFTPYELYLKFLYEHFRTELNRPSELEDMYVPAGFLPEVIANFDANAFNPADKYRILVTTEVLSEGVNLHRSNVVINYDIPWNPTRLIQRVGRVNRVDTQFDTIHTFNFFPSEEGNEAIKLREAAEAKIHAFIEMLGSDARLLTEGEELKSFDLFAKLNSKKTITGEDEEEESELEYLTEIRNVRDKQPDFFARIKRLPKKARSSRTLQSETDIPVFASENTGKNACATFPALLTYFRQGRLDKFYLATNGPSTPVELDFLATVKVLKPVDPDEARKAIPPGFYALLDRNKAAFAEDTSPENDDAIPHHKGSANDAYILKRLKAKEVRRYHGFTDEDEDFIREVIQLLLDGALPKPTTKKVAAALKKEIDPLKVLGILKRDISPLFFKATRAQQMHHASMPREVILSSWIISGEHAPEKESAE